MTTKKKKQTKRCNLSINLSGYDLNEIIGNYIKSQIGDIDIKELCVNSNVDNIDIINAGQNEFQVYLEFNREMR
jgi:hypothetical protein